MFTGMRYEARTLLLIDQRALPHQEIWIECTDLERCAWAIEAMVVRGAPAIAATAAFALAMDSGALAGLEPFGKYKSRLEAAIRRLAATRPTAVNLFHALNGARRLSESFSDRTPMTEVQAAFEDFARKLHARDLETCKAIGRHGSALAKGRPLTVLTHCNTGSLATAGYGTALGVIRALHERNLIKTVYVDETRPYLQGARLTAFELQQEGIPYHLIVDAAAPWLMHEGRIDMVVVGADRIAANGDTANKIGTYGLAVQCAHHGIPFYVAAPATTFDSALASGMSIPVEERDPGEVRAFGGRPTGPLDAPVRNPSFDVTPASLISGIITEKGVLEPPYRISIRDFLR